MKPSPTVLFLVDGLRPEAVEAAPMPALLGLAQSGAWRGTARSVMPNSTLPCHFSIFHSVLPERHGITSNTWTPQVRPLPGLFETLTDGGKEVGFAYNWEQLRDLARPGKIAHAFFTTMDKEGSDAQVANNTIAMLRQGADFVFCYLGETDEVGHKYGWMSPEYLQAAHNADRCIARVLDVLPADASVLVMADHGGHDRTHGTDCREDMTVPLFIHAPRHEVTPVENPLLLDIAPTLATLCGVPVPAQWEGRSLVRGN